MSSLVVYSLRVYRISALQQIEYLCNSKLCLHNHTLTTPRERFFLAAMLVASQIRELWADYTML